MVNAFVDAFNQPLQEADLSAQVDGITRTFVVPQSFNSEYIVVYYNGVRQLRTDITVLTATTFSLSFVPQSNTAIVVVYKAL